MTVLVSGFLDDAELSSGSNRSSKQKKRVEFETSYLYGTLKKKLVVVV